LFKIPAEGGAPVRLWDKAAYNPVWSPDGALIAFVGPAVGRLQTLFLISPDGHEVPMGEITATNADGTVVRKKDITVRGEGQRMRFLPKGNALILMQSVQPAQDFYLLDLATKKSRQLTKFTNPAAMMTFDITPDGKRIVFDRIKDNTDIVLIERAKA
jgi:Tol biopolymer transport system component